MDSCHFPFTMKNYRPIIKGFIKPFSKAAFTIEAIAFAMAFLFYIVSVKLYKEIRSLFAPNIIRGALGQLEPDLAQCEAKEAPFSLYSLLAITGLSCNCLVSSDRTVLKCCLATVRGLKVVV